jgi:hypothetical protein
MLSLVDGAVERFLHPWEKCRTLMYWMQVMHVYICVRLDSAKALGTSA